jgi:hypothetical protein
MDNSKPKVAAQIGDACRQLQSLARDADLAFIAHLIGIVIAETNQYRSDGHTPAPGIQP